MVVVRRKKDVFNCFFTNMFEKNFYCVSSRVEHSGQLYGCFKIGPFYRHQSLTFANALRRTLLADRSRCTFDAVQINGVEHEFSSLIGVRESVIDILLNLEKLIFQLEKPITKPQVAFINFCGPGILRADHIHLPSNFKCVIPSQYIATLEVDGKLTLKLFFSPDWKKFQFFIQNLIFDKKDNLNTHSFKPKYALPPKFSKKQNKPIHFQKNLKNLFKHRYRLISSLSNSKNASQKENFTVPKLYNLCLSQDEELSSSSRLAQGRKRTPSSPRGRIAPPGEPQGRLRLAQHGERAPRTLAAKAASSQGGIVQLAQGPTIINNRLKIINYLTKTLFQSNQIHLQRLGMKFQFLNFKISLQKFNISIDRYTTRSQKQQGKPKTNINKKYYFLKKNKKSLIFAKTIQENFLFLNSSLCAIENVNYTLQSIPKKTINYTDFTAKTRTTQHSADSIKKSNIRFFTSQARQRPSQTKVMFKNPNKSFYLKYQLKLNSPASSELAARRWRLALAASPAVAAEPPLGERKHPLYNQKKLENETHLSRVSYNQSNNSFRPTFRNITNRLSPNYIQKKQLFFPKKEEFIFFEIWTDGSIHPQTAILKAINELLLEMFPYSLQISKYEKTNQLSENNIFSFINRLNSLKFIQNSLKRKDLINQSKKSFREKFLNLEIGNFYFDLDTYLFLKKQKIHRIVDFLNFCNQKEMTKTVQNHQPFKQKIFNQIIDSQIKKQQVKSEIKRKLYKFKIFLDSFIN